MKVQAMRAYMGADAIPSDDQGLLGEVRRVIQRDDDTVMFQRGSTAIPEALPTEEFEGWAAQEVMFFLGRWAAA